MCFPNTGGDYLQIFRFGGVTILRFLEKGGDTEKKCKMEILRVTANCERYVEVEPLRSSVCLSVLVFPFVWYSLPSYILEE